MRGPKRSDAQKSAATRPDKEFLPAALEILETPASPRRAAMIALICSAVVLSIAWASFGKIDIVATAQGKVQPVGRVKIAQSEDSGRVVRIHAGNGDQVAEGAVLIELDATAGKAEVQALTLKERALTGEIARRHAQHDIVEVWRQGDVWQVQMPVSPVLLFPPSLVAATIERERRLYRADVGKLATTIGGLAAQRRKAVAQIERLEGTIVAQRRFVATLGERASMRQKLADAEAGSRASVIDASQVLQEAERDLAAQTGEMKEALATLDVIESQANGELDAFLADNAGRLVAAERELAVLTEELKKARRRLAAMTIVSPASGIVQASAVTTLGQVIAPGVELMRIVPADGMIEIEGYLANRDIGFVAVGQEAVIKVEAFPFTRYGVLTGKVARVATDAIPEPDARQLEELSSGNLQSTVQVTNAQRLQNLVYPIVITLPKESAISTGGRAVALSPGMAVTVEIKTGQRRIVDYLFSPLAEVSAGAMKER